MVVLCPAVGAARVARAANLPRAAGSPAPPAAASAPRVALSARFTPDRLGQSTTIHWAFHVLEPAPLRSIELRLPPGMGFAGSSLGLEPCEPELLAQYGPEGCPLDSHLGFGAALGVLPIEPHVQEPTKVTALLGPPQGEDMTVLFFIDGKWPANKELILTAQVREIAGPHGAALLTGVPQLPVWPGGPDILLLRFRSTIGPERLTYHRRVGNRTVSFKPRGLSLPASCPPDGFPVSASFQWWTTEAISSATVHVACPRR
jgi:hypothetical protein